LLKRTFGHKLRQTPYAISSLPRKSSTMSSQIQVYSNQYIDGEWVKSTNDGLPDSEKYIDVLDSNSDTVFARVINGSRADMQKAISAAEKAFPSWSRTSVQERKKYMQRVLKEYGKRQQAVADALQKELGAPKFLAERVQSVMFSAHVSTAIQVAEQLDWKEDLGQTVVVKEPVGVVGAITPWNWPLNQIGCKIGPALMAGCTVVLKPSEVTPINAYLISEAIHAAGLPKGVFNMVCGKGKDCGEELAVNPKVDMVSFTGSTAVGRHLHALGANQIKRVRTELGGKSAAVIMDDATPQQIGLMAGNVLGNTGQSCNALSRLLVPKSRYDECCQIAKATFESVKVTEPSNPKASRNDIGPLSSRQQLEKVTGYIQKGIDEGARVITGGLGTPPGVSESGYYVKPTVFADVHNKMTIAQEEIFGPVLCIIPYETESEAIEIANDTIYGLSNGVAGSDMERALDIASQLRSGQVHVNSVNQSLLAPFGGYKQSGDGREWGKYGFEDFLQIKSINKPAPKKAKL